MDLFPTYHRRKYCTRATGENCCDCGLPVKARDRSFTDFDPVHAKCQDKDIRNECAKDPTFARLIHIKLREAEIGQGVMRNYGVGL